MKRLLLFLMLLPFFSPAQTGSISGNAYWHYNDYVGDKADAGSDMYLFAGESGKSPQNTQCDVMGNFKFDNLLPGDYMLLIISKNTTDDGSYNFIPFNAYHEYSKKFLGFDIRDQKAAYDSVAILDRPPTKARRVGQSETPDSCKSCVERRCDGSATPNFFTLDDNSEKSQLEHCYIIWRSK